MQSHAKKLKKTESFTVIRNFSSFVEDEKLKQKKGLPSKVKKAARVIHKFGMKKGYFPNL